MEEMLGPGLVLEEPYNLISVPKPFGSKDAAYGAAAVTHFSKGRIGRGHEVAVAIDGEGIYIYSIDNPRLLRSYALPPDTTFLCPPQCFVWRRPAASSQRVTIAAYRSGAAQGTRLVCFVEGWQKNASSATDLATSQKFEHSLSSANIELQSISVQHYDAKADELSQAFRVYVVSRCGHVHCLPADLSSEIWTYSMLDAAEPGGEIEFAQLQQLDRAQKDLIKDRPDITANLATTSGSDQVLVVVRAQKAGDRIERSVLVLDLDQSEQRQHHVRTATLGLHKVADLPKPAGMSGWNNPQKFQYIHGSFFTSQSEALVCWRRQQSLQFKASTTRDVSSCIPLSATTALVVSSARDSASLHDFQWDTKHAQLALPHKLANGTKRSRDSLSASLEGSTDFIAFYSRTGTAIALSQGKLIAWRVLASHGTKRRRVGNTSLADAVGAGSMTQGDDALESFSTRVREYAKRGASDELDKFLIEEFSIVPLRRAAAANGFSAQNGAPETSEPIEPAHTSSARSVDTRRGRIVLREIMQVDGSRLRLLCFPENIVQWLVSTRQLSHQTGLMDALAHFDPTLETMGRALNWPASFDVQEVVRALGIVIDSLDNPIDHATTEQQLTNGVDHETDGSINDASAAAENDLAFAIASLNHGTAIRGSLLRAVFTRLDTFAIKDTIPALRTALNPRQLVFLINLLRIELADGGWTTRYTDYATPHPTDRPEKDDDDDAAAADDNTSGPPADGSIGIIVKLLGAAVDAIGANGWNVGLAADRQLNTDEMLLVLRAEVAAALEGTLDCQGVGAILLDFNKYCASAAASPAERAARRRKRKQAAAARGRGEDGGDLVGAKAMGVGFLLSNDGEDVALPLGCSVESIETTTVSKGGRIAKKGPGAIGVEVSSRVGRYSMDRIRV